MSRSEEFSPQLSRGYDAESMRYAARDEARDGQEQLGSQIKQQAESEDQQGFHYSKCESSLISIYWSCMMGRS